MKRMHDKKNRKLSEERIMRTKGEKKYEKRDSFHASVQSYFSLYLVGISLLIPKRDFNYR